MGMKRFLRWWNRKSGHKYLNGGKGVISIFLIAVMLPFVGLADLLVESARYHSAVTILDEAMDSSGLSVLADYDEYLFDRFGLLAIDNSAEISEDYRMYMEKNTESLNAWGLNDISAQGSYALTDNQILIKEIAEFSQYSAPAALANDLGLSDLISALERMTKMTDTFEIITGMGNVTGSMVDVSNALNDLKTIAGSFEAGRNDYTTKYNEFALAFSNLATAVNVRDQKRVNVDEIENQLKEFSKTADIQEKIGLANAELDELEQKKQNQQITDEEYEEGKKNQEELLTELQKELNTALEENENLQKDFQKAQEELQAAEDKILNEKTALTNSKDAYFDSIGHIIGIIDEYMTQSDTLLENLETLATSGIELGTKVGETEVNHADKVEELNRQKDELEKKAADEQDSKLKEEYKESIEEIENQIVDYKAGGANISAAGNNVKNKVENYSNDLRESMKEYNAEQLNEYVSLLTSVQTRLVELNVDSVTSQSILDRGQYYVEISGGFLTSASIQSIMDTLEEQMTGGGLMSKINGFGTTMRSLFTTNLFFDARLTSYISESTGYAGSDMDLILNDFSRLINLMDGTGSGLVGLVNVVLRLNEIVQAMIDLISHIMNYLAGMVTRAVTALSELLSNQCGEKLLIDEYLVKILPNRTSISDTGQINGKNPFTGYPYSKVKFAEHSNQVPVLGDINALVDLFSDIKNGGDDLMFSGAEAEYILIGSRSEAVNQAVAFFQIYFARLLIDMPQILGNKEVTAIANATTPIGAVIIYILYIFIEPMIDTILIVNGVEISLILKVVYFTPTGLTQLVSHLTSLGLDSEEQEKIKSKAEEICNISSISGVLNKDTKGITWKYENYLFLLMLVSLDNETAVERFCNIVMLEAKAYYGQDNFDIEKTYTCIEGTVKGKFDPVLPFGSIATGGLFEQERSRMRGY